MRVLFLNDHAGSPTRMRACRHPGVGRFPVYEIPPCVGGGLVFKAHRWLYHSILGSRVIKKKKKDSCQSNIAERFPTEEVCEGANVAGMLVVINPTLGEEFHTFEFQSGNLWLSTWPGRKSGC